MESHVYCMFKKFKLYTIAYNLQSLMTPLSTLTHYRLIAVSVEIMFCIVLHCKFLELFLIEFGFESELKLFQLHY